MREIDWATFRFLGNQNLDQISRAPVCIGELWTSAPYCIGEWAPQTETQHAASSPRFRTVGRDGACPVFALRRLWESELSVPHQAVAVLAASCLQLSAIPN